MEKLKNCVAIGGAGYKLLGLATNPNEQLGANLVQLRRGRKGTLHLYISGKEHQPLHFPFPSCK
jgi:hypothetical protein